MEWYSMVGEDCEYQIEWSFGTGLNLRAKFRSEQFWRYAECEKAEHALSIGEQLLRRGENETTYSILDYSYFDPDG